MTASVAKMKEDTIEFASAFLLSIMKNSVEQNCNILKSKDPYNEDHGLSCANQDDQSYSGSSLFFATERCEWWLTVKPHQLPESILASLKAPLWGHYYFYYSSMTYLNRYPQVLSHDCLLTTAWCTGKSTQQMTWGASREKLDKNI